MDKIKLNNIDPATRGRIFEVFAIAVVSAVLILVSRLESRLIELSSSLAKDDSFIPSVVFYGIVNLNVLLLIVLSFVVVRHLAKLMIDRRNGVFGSSLRSRLIGTLLVFALVPTGISFYVSNRFIQESFDKWFGDRIKTTIQDAKDASSLMYLQDQRRLEGNARATALKVITKASPSFITSIPLIKVPASQLELEYGVNSVKIFDRNGDLVWDSATNNRSLTMNPIDKQEVGSILGRFATQKHLHSISTVSTTNSLDIVRSYAPVFTEESQELAGVVAVEEQFDIPFLGNLQKIIDGFSGLRPASQLVKVSFQILVSIMTLSILFGAIWFGFKVARAITEPIQLLAQATREVALGNYSIKLNPTFDDETGALMKSFNTMTADLTMHQRDARDSQLKLQLSNEELERRRQYMEIVFRNIASGVIAVDAIGNVTAFNNSAQNLLKVPSSMLVQGRHIREILGKVLSSTFWDEIASQFNLQRGSTFSREIDLRPTGIDLALFVAATEVIDAGENFGIVVVFDDARLRLKQEKLIAWREVASRVAHEIKNPMTPIKLSAERLLRRFQDRFEGDEKKVFESCIQSILLQVESLKRLVNEFGQFTRLPQLKLLPTEFNQLVDSSSEVFRQAYPTIKFTLHPSNSPLILQIDSEQMNRAIVNLLSNAVESIVEKHPQGGGTITMTIETSENKCRLWIKDNGKGVPEELKSKIFDPYFSTKSTGTGLGLAITNQIVAEHNGDVRVNASSSEGTLIVLELPIS